MNGGESVMWCSKSTIGDACISERMPHKSIIRNMRERTLEKSLSNGFNQSANHVTNLNISGVNEFKFMALLHFIVFTDNRHENKNLDRTE